MTFVLIPGAGGDAGYWRLVLAELHARGHEAIAVDLPAHDERAGIPEYADAVVAAIGERADVILVAQSMGGFTAAAVAERMLVRMVVFLNAMIPAAGEHPGAWWASTGQDQARREMDVRDGRDPDAEFDPFVVFLHDVPRAVVEAMPLRQQSDTPFTAAWTPQPWPDVPTRVLIGGDDRFFPVGFQRRVAEERVGITPDEIPGGHCVALSRPAELADRLEAYRAEL